MEADYTKHFFDQLMLMLLICFPIKGCFIFLVGCLLCHFLGISILYNSGLVNRDNKKNKNLVKFINLVIVLIISILLIPGVYKVLIQL